MREDRTGGSLVCVGIQVVDAPPNMAAEDFVFILSETPGCYFCLVQRDGENPGIHSSFFDFNDKVLPFGGARSLSTNSQTAAFGALQRCLPNSNAGGSGPHGK